MPLSKSSVPNCLQLLCRSFVPVPIFVDRIPCKLAPLGRRGWGPAGNIGRRIFAVEEDKVRKGRFQDEEEKDMEVDIKI